MTTLLYILGSKSYITLQILFLFYKYHIIRYTNQNKLLDHNVCPHYKNNIYDRFIKIT